LPPQLIDLKEWEVAWRGEERRGEERRGEERRGEERRGEERRGEAAVSGKCMILIVEPFMLFLFHPVAI
jgi:hypothetical protein